MVLAYFILGLAHLAISYLTPLLTRTTNGIVLLVLHHTVPVPWLIKTEWLWQVTLFYWQCHRHNGAGHLTELPWPYKVFLTFLSAEMQSFSMRLPELSQKAINVKINKIIKPFIIFRLMLQQICCIRTLISPRVVMWLAHSWVSCGKLEILSPDREMSPFFSVSLTSLSPPVNQPICTISSLLKLTHSFFFCCHTRSTATLWILISLQPCNYYYSYYYYYYYYRFMTFCPGLPRSVGTRRKNHSGFCWSRHDVGGSGISWTICKLFALHSRK